MLFDKRLSRWSLFVDGTADGLIALLPASQGSFIALSCLSSFTSGGNPALHSFGAVCLHAAGRSSEVGTLYGSLGFMGATAHIIAVCAHSVMQSFSFIDVCLARDVCPYIHQDGRNIS